MGMFSWIKRKICKDPEPEKTDVATVVDGLVEKDSTERELLPQLGIS